MESVKTQRRARGRDQILDILEFFGAAEAPISPQALAEALGLPRSTAYAMLTQLHERGWLARQDQGYVPGAMAMRLGFAAGQAAQFEPSVRAILHRLALTTATTVELNIIDEWKLLLTHVASGLGAIYSGSREGARYPLPLSASARVLLAGVPMEALKHFIPPEDLRTHDGTALSFEGFHRDIVEAQQRGYAVVEGMGDVFAAPMSIPIFDGFGQPLAALSVVMARREVPEAVERYLPAMQEAVRALEQLLRYSPWPLAAGAYRRLLSDMEQFAHKV